jgi:hypothetical protein
VAAFARAPRGRLFFVEILVALLASATVVWFLHTAWFPTIRKAIGQLPGRGVIERGQLDYPSDGPALLAETDFLALRVIVEGRTSSDRADIQIEFDRAHARLCSLLGCWTRPYPRDYRLAFNREELVPWWGAWRPIFLGLAAVLMGFTLLSLWAALATVYAPVAWVMGYFADRDLSLAGSWRLASAALMPGALLLTLAILSYGLRLLDLPRFMIFAALHVAVGWVYLALAPLALPPASEAEAPARPANPFGVPDAPVPAEGDAPSDKPVE